MADLAERLRELDLSGIALITGPDGVEFEECFGLADRAAGIPVTPATRFGLASVTKMFTAVTVATLGVDVAAPVVCAAAAGAAALDAAAGRDRAPLLSHTSHIADYAEEEGPDPVEYETLWTDRPCYRFERRPTSCRCSPIVRRTGRPAAGSTTPMPASSCSG
jgi:hypothetical protein